jgi:esterase
VQTPARQRPRLAYLEIGRGPPLVCVHGTLGDFRTWSMVFGPLSKTRPVISVSLPRSFPEHWDGAGDDYLMSQHVADVIGFIEKLDAGPLDLMGHSRGGHISFRVAERRPELLRKLILVNPAANWIGRSIRRRLPALRRAGRGIAVAAGKISGGDIDGGLAVFFDMIEGEGAWARLPAAPKQQLRDNAFTLIGQVDENRQPYTKAGAQSIGLPTLFIGGAETKGALPAVLRALAAQVPGCRTAMISGGGHWMFEQAPQEFSRIVLAFLEA